MNKFSQIFGVKPVMDSCLEHKHHSCNHINSIAGVALLLFVTTLSISLISLASKDDGSSLTAVIVKNQINLANSKNNKRVLGASTSVPQMVSSQFMAIHDFTQTTTGWNATLMYVRPSQDTFSLIRFPLKDNQRGPVEVVTSKITKDDKLDIVILRNETWEYVLTDKPNGKGSEVDSLIVSVP